MSEYVLLRLVSISSFTICCVMSVSFGRSRTISFLTLKIDCPLTPTYTCEISLLRAAFSFPMMLVMPWMVFSRLCAVPFLIYVEESSLAMA